MIDLSNKESEKVQEELDLVHSSDEFDENEKLLFKDQISSYQEGKKLMNTKLQKEKLIQDNRIQQYKQSNDVIRQSVMVLSDQDEVFEIEIVDEHLLDDSEDSNDDKKSDATKGSKVFEYITGDKDKMDKSDLFKQRMKNSSSNLQYQDVHSNFYNKYFSKPNES